MEWAPTKQFQISKKNHYENFRPLIALFAILMDPREFVGTCIAQTNTML